MKTNLKLTIYGTRGSHPVFGKEYMKYGGSTSCYLLEAERQAIVIDAGSGMAGIGDISQKQIPVIITHSHIDHLLGLTSFKYINDKEKEITLYLAKRDGLSPRKQIESLISKPLWPCKITDYPAEITIKELKVNTEPLEFGGIKVFSMDASHPGGSTIFRFEYQNKKIVLATDHEHDDEYITRELTKFSKDADLILYDAQYTEEEYKKSKGYGHSTAEAGIKLKKASGAEQMIFVHHSPAHRDEFMDKENEKYRGCDVHFAYEGEVIEI